ncbi:MAG: hypothetical protein U5L09_05310 [Bacteroidales bacterium]|nr:hypothetical protein [Bacteroidales bacterium]
MVFHEKVIGVDYGSKYAGTTVVAMFDDNKVVFKQSKVKANADNFLSKLIKNQLPEHVFIDAPLSLPGVYCKPDNYSDYFYRQSDREAGAMSPMFLGGLTARAIQLKNQFSETKIFFKETYPGGLANELYLKEMGYKKQISHCDDLMRFLEDFSGFNVEKNIVLTWHHVDALLTLVSAKRYFSGEHNVLGDPEEGQIIF